MRVVVPWQSGVRIGLCVGFSELKPSRGLELKEALAVLDQAPWVSRAGLQMLAQVAAATASAPGTVLANLLATGLHDALSHQVRALVPLADAPELRVWQDARTVDLARLELWRKQGLLEERVQRAVKEVQVLLPLKDGDQALDGPRAAAQRQALAHLQREGSFASAAELARAAGVSVSAVRALISKGYAGYAMRPAPPFVLEPLKGEGEQIAASAHTLQGVKLGAYAPYRIAGGRRKSRVLALAPLIKQCLQAGKSVLVLLPEQGFVHEAAALLAASFPVYRLTGESSDEARQALWGRAQQPQVLVSSYLGLLLPLDLGAVVVLEDASSSYKLPSGCRVFVPTAAKYLAQAANIPWLAGSSLNALELYQQVPEALALPQPLPRVHVSDLNAGAWPLSNDLVHVLKQIEARGRQAVLLAPRRGFSAGLRCRDCGQAFYCPHCSVTLHYHDDGKKLRCHQCGFERTPPEVCPNCQGMDLVPAKAAGTQWIARAVAKVVPSLKVYRYDGDKRDALTPLYAGEPGVLVGTTACLRLAALPQLSLIALTLFDAFAALGDFRAEENTLRLLLDVLELTPVRESARRPLLLLQTFNPQADVIAAFCKGDYEAFCQQKLELRERFAYPPFGALTRLQLSHRQEAKAQAAAEKLSDFLLSQGVPPADLMGPNPAPLARVRGQYSYQILLRAPEDKMAALLVASKGFSLPAKLRLDVDPRDVSGFLE